MKLKAYIGLEIHIELETKSKMFCRCSANYFGSKPNTHVCPVCLGLPGALPVPNKKAIELTVMVGQALNCRINSFSKFDRKNYSYPDLPKGYQISQYDLPFCKNGEFMDVGITRAHLEEDTAKLTHVNLEGKEVSLIDFNRSGVPLLEVVTEPDIKTSKQAKEFLKKLTQTIRYLGVSGCDMEKGSMRLEVNISLGENKLPDYKVELKNLNSFRFVEKAIEYEIKRHLEIFKKGEKPIQETRGWDEKKQRSFSQRTKEEAQDYRYFPEPDIPPIRLGKEEINKIKNSIPELPEQKKDRFMKDYGLSEYNALLLTENMKKANFFEQTAILGDKEKIEAKKIANILINRKVNIGKISPKEFIKDILDESKKPQITDKDLDKIIKIVLQNNQEVAKEIRKGKETAIEFLVGQVMKKAKGQVSPSQARETFREKIKSA